MPQNKTIKFFISSTFRDFIKERNALQNFVFPRLKKLCEEKDFSFQPVDLRWGVTDESSEDNKTMEYCLNEVKRCSSDPKPNLLILFGQRYGWGPLPSYIERDIFDIISRKIDDIDFTKELFPNVKNKWLKDIEKELDKEKKDLFQSEYNNAIEYKFKDTNLKELLNEWYIEDLNDLDKKYYLKDKKNVNPLIWRFIEKTLKTYIQKVEETRDERYYDDFHTSATEQEIKLALKKQEDIKSQNTIVYSRKFAKETTEKDFIEEMETEKLDKLEKYLKNNNLCTFTEKDSIDLDTYKDLDDEYIPLEIESYKEENYPQNMPDYLKEFCESIYEKFEKKIKTEIKTFNENLSTPLKIELEEQEKFLKSKYLVNEKESRKVINDVIGRNDEVDDILKFVNEPKEQYYLLYGKSGSGKTSVMAKAITDLKNENNKYDIYYRFIGTSANSTFSRQVFESIYWEIETRLRNDKNLIQPNFEPEDRKFKKQFKEKLNKLENKKVIIFLDAIDQFEDDNDLTILLNELPSNIKIVFSVLFDENKSDNEDYTTYYNKLKYIENQKILNILDQKSNIDILYSLLNKDNRTLSSDKNNNQQDLVEKFIEGQTPLCVKLTYEIVREWTSTEKINHLKNELPNIDSKNKEEELITMFFNNVIKKHYVKAELLDLTLGLISASKDGLSESELIDIISNEKDLIKSYDEKGRYQELNKLPSSIFSKMYYHIQDIFTEKLIDNVLLINSYHRIIEETIRKEYYDKNLHDNIVEYFVDKDIRVEKRIEKKFNLRLINEVPYNCICNNNLFYLIGFCKEVEFLNYFVYKSNFLNDLNLIKIINFINSKNEEDFLEYCLVANLNNIEENKYSFLTFFFILFSKMKLYNIFLYDEAKKIVSDEELIQLEINYLTHLIRIEDNNTALEKAKEIQILMNNQNYSDEKGKLYLYNSLARLSLPNYKSSLDYIGKAKELSLKIYGKDSEENLQICMNELEYKIILIGNSENTELVDFSCLENEISNLLEIATRIFPNENHPLIADIFLELFSSLYILVKRTDIAEKYILSSIKIYKTLGDDINTNKAIELLKRLN